MTKPSEAFQEMVGALNALIGVFKAVHTNVWAILLVFFALAFTMTAKMARHRPSARGRVGSAGKGSKLLSC